MHDWSDKSFDWKGLNEALDLMERILRFYRVPVRQVKEKYGTARIYTGLGWSTPHSLFYPGYMYSKFPKWLWTIDVYHGRKIMYWTGLAYVGYKLHCWAYRRAYAKAVKKFPHLRKEIMCMADYPELLEGL